MKMWYTYTMDYYSAIKNNEIMPFTATRMDRDITPMLDRERQMSYGSTHTWNLIF